jgi:hypothetical protein
MVVGIAIGVPFETNSTYYINPFLWILEEGIWNINGVWTEDGLWNIPT